MKLLHDIGRDAEIRYHEVGSGSKNNEVPWATRTSSLRPPSIS